MNHPSEGRAPGWPAVVTNDSGTSKLHIKYRTLHLICRALPWMYNALFGLIATWRDSRGVGYVWDHAQVMLRESSRRIAVFLHLRDATLQKDVSEKEVSDYVTQGPHLSEMKAI